MKARPEVTINLKPQTRLDLIDVRNCIAQEYGDLFASFKRVLYYSYHTTAGYLDPKFCARLNHDYRSLEAFVQDFQQIFPPNADYRHDQLSLRSELTEQQRMMEPKNADAHLTFIGSGFTNLVTYANEPYIPVYFIDLDGVNGKTRRNRKTSVVGFNREATVSQIALPIPVSAHPIDSVNLKSPNLGLFEQLQDEIRKHDVTRGRIDLALDTSEHHVGLTVNEFETLLMRHDLAKVLRNPLRFMAERGKRLFTDPRSIPSRAKGYAKYDLVQLINEVLDALDLSESVLERVIHKFMAFPASRFMRMKRSVSLLVTEAQGVGRIVEGTYQSPILVQWGRAVGQVRGLRASIVSFD